MPASGPLRVHRENPRYFMDASGRAVYLTGSHTWNNLIDRGPSDPPPVFDFDEYLKLLERHHHNFIRLWGRQVSWYHDYGKGVLHAGPLAWPRSGPGNALDGKPKFDLAKFDEAYFARLRQRVKAAGDRGIYVSIMLFGGHYECSGGWRGSPFHAKNNINGIDGDASGDGEGFEAHTLAVPAITRLQEAYVRKVIDTVNDLDNVLFEISNEGDDSSTQWQYHLIKFIHDDEAKRPKQHPVGMTAIWSGEKGNPALAASPAEWISPQTDGHAIPVADGRKVSLLDSDHWFVKDIVENPKFGRAWVWKSLCQGHNPILMEHLPPLSAVLEDLPFAPDDPGYAASRTALGQARRLAERMNLSAMTPHPELATTRFCLADVGEEYLIYVPRGDALTVNLSKARGNFIPHWLNAATGKSAQAEDVSGGAEREMASPLDGEAVLHLVRRRS